MNGLIDPRLLSLAIASTISALVFVYTDFKSAGFFAIWSLLLAILFAVAI